MYVTTQQKGFPLLRSMLSIVFKLDPITVLQNISLDSSVSVLLLLLQM